MPASLSTVSLLLLTLFLSGIAAIINQTVWQRSLKIYLAGCESASSMIVVLTFMLGLGLGSIFMGRRAHRVRRVLRTLALIELSLFAVNLLISYALSFDIAESLYSFQRMAVSLGVPLRVVYGFMAGTVLLVPCFLMGTTMPLASEAAQRELGIDSSRFLTVLFVLNTLGSVLGGLASGFYLLPYLGQLSSLFVASLCNGAAGVVLLVLTFVQPGLLQPSTAEQGLGFRSSKLTSEEILGFWFGVLSLGYEMYLFRIVSLLFQPLPYNFSLVLCYFLFFWSVGLFVAKRMRECIPLLLLLTGVSVAAMPIFCQWHHTEFAAGISRRLQLGGMNYFMLLSLVVFSIPCVLFGCGFGQVMAKCAKNWGNDIGRFYAINTFGCCLGIVFFTLVGYELNHAYSVLFIGLCYLLLFARYRQKEEFVLALPAQRKFAVRALVVGLLLLLAILLPWHGYQDALAIAGRGDRSGKATTYYGRDGVIEISPDRNMIWDGLWHSRLAEQNDHIGTNNWLMAAIPFICHDNQEIEDALVVGMGTGITAAVLAESPQIKTVDTYEINTTIVNLLRDYPDGTLRVAENPKIQILWQDGRSGLALNPKQYDLITSAPLYLKQAGSSLLLSREYFQLARKRLKPGGVFAVYSNSMGNAEQALLVRQTIASVFPYHESFQNGYLLVASNEPIVFEAKNLERLASTDLLARQILAQGVEKMQSLHDQPPLHWQTTPHVVTDNHPLLEYPNVVKSVFSHWREQQPLVASPAARRQP